MMSKRLAFYFDSSSCTGCKACELACKDKNDLPIGVRFRRVWNYGGGDWVPDDAQPGILVPNNVFTYSVSVACMHCENAACTQVCPTGAMTKRADGIVYVDANRCIGCRYCEWTCPYGAPQYNPSKGVMQKCDMCKDLVDAGETPACVAICPMRALDFGEYDELVAKYGPGVTVAPLPSADLTQPSFVLTPHPSARLSKDGGGKLIVLNQEA
jgi:anaerobic dimethyl sulfoxide reductase subunit B